MYVTKTPLVIDPEHLNQGGARNSLNNQYKVQTGQNTITIAPTAWGGAHTLEIQPATAKLESSQRREKWSPCRGNGATYQSYRGW